MHYCLSKEETRHLLVAALTQRPVETQELCARWESAERWEDEIACLNYLTAMIVAGAVADGHDALPAVRWLYAQQDVVWLTIQECDHQFISYMFRDQRQDGLSLEDVLRETQRRLGECVYE